MHDTKTKAGHAAHRASYGDNGDVSQNVTKVVTYQSLTRWYRKVLDNGMYNDRNQKTNMNVVNTGLKDGSGLMVDFDEFCNLLLECHYKTRIATRPQGGTGGVGGGKKRATKPSARAKSPAAPAAPAVAAPAPAAAPAVK